MIAAVLLLCAGVSRAGELALKPSPFETGYVSSVKASLAQDPLFASRLLQSFDFHLAATASAADKTAAAKNLAAAIDPDSNLKRASALLGAGPVGVGPAGAMLAASAFAAPKQFASAASRLEAVKPGLGARLVESLREKTGRDAKLSPPMLTYGRDGKLDLLFDGGR